MTTVRTPRAAAGTVALDGVTAPALPVSTVPVPDDLAVIPDAVAEPDVVDGREALPGDRLKRLQQRQRLLREEFLAVTFLFVMLAITVGVLAMQWLGSGGAAS